jgi:hypothetical protein
MLGKRRPPKRPKQGAKTSQFAGLIWWTSTLTKEKAPAGGAFLVRGVCALMTQIVLMCLLGALRRVA